MSKEIISLWLFFPLAGFVLAILVRKSGETSEWALKIGYFISAMVFMAITGFFVIKG